MQTNQAGGPRRRRTDSPRRAVDPPPRGAGSAAGPNRASRGHAWYRRLPGVGLAALLAGCAAPHPKPVAAAGPAARVYAIDLTGAAKHCTAPTPRLTDGKTATVAMTVGNDGGWCAITLARRDGTAGPYAAGLLLAGPAHGKVYVHTVGDATRIDYTPRPGFVGPDQFTVSLLPSRPIVVVRVRVVG